MFSYTCSKTLTSGLLKRILASISLDHWIRSGLACPDYHGLQACPGHSYLDCRSPCDSRCQVKHPVFLWSGRPPGSWWSWPHAIAMGEGQSGRERLRGSEPVPQPTPFSFSSLFPSLNTFRLYRCIIWLLGSSAWIHRATFIISVVKNIAPFDSHG